MAAPGPSRWNSTALPAASGTSSDPETATSVRSVIAAAATPRRRRPPGESGSPLPRTGSGARPQSTSSLGECISGPTMLHVFPSPRRLLIEQALHGTIAPARPDHAGARGPHREGAAVAAAAGRAGGLLDRRHRGPPARRGHAPQPPRRTADRTRPPCPLHPLPVAAHRHSARERLHRSPRPSAMICALEVSKHRVPKRVSLVLLIGGGRLLCWSLLTR